METRKLTDSQDEPGRKQRKPYERPVLVQYGALEEVTQGYIQTTRCRAPGQCING